MEANWYIVKLVFSVTQGGDQAPEQFDEQWRILQASGSEAAFAKATEIGLSESEIITRNDNSSIEWKFLTVTDIFPFDALQDGAEIFSRTESPDNASFYRQSAMAKAAQFVHINEHSELTWSLES